MWNSHLICIPGNDGGAFFSGAVDDMEDDDETRIGDT